MYRRSAPVVTDAAVLVHDPLLTTRRQVLSAAAIAAPPLLLGGAVGAAISQLGDFRIRQFDLRIPGLPPKLDGLTIAHLSDFHVGRFMTPAMMRQVIDTVNDMKPDLALVTGDLIDYALIDLPAALDEIKRLRPNYGLRNGLSMCIGNHDAIESGHTFHQQVRDAGVPILVDDSRVIEVAGHPIELLGINWFIGEAKTADAVAARHPAARSGGVSHFAGASSACLRRGGAAGNSPHARRSHPRRAAYAHRKLRRGIHHVPVLVRSLPEEP